MNHTHYIRIHASIGSPLAKSFLVCLLAFGLCVFLIGPTDAAFTATATIDNNSMTTGVLSPPFTPGPGDVVVNEIQWMGSAADSNDEWIELRNMTSESIDLAGWKVDGLGLVAATVVISSGTLAPNSFFLVGNFASNASAVSDTVTMDYVTTSVSLVNGGEQLTLKDATDTVIDQTPAGAWAAGENAAEKKSMERNSVPGDGTLAASWHTCVDAGCNDTTYWDAEGANYGTPRATNLSINDLTAEDFDLLFIYVAPEEVPAMVVEDATSTEHVTTVEDEEEASGAGGGEGSGETTIDEVIGGDEVDETETPEDTGGDQPGETEEGVDGDESDGQEEPPQSDTDGESDTGESSNTEGSEGTGDDAGSSGGGDSDSGGGSSDSGSGDPGGGGGEGSSGDSGGGDSGGGGSGGDGSGGSSGDNGGVSGGGDGGGG